MTLRTAAAPLPRGEPCGCWPVMGAKLTQTVVLLVLAKVLTPSEFGVLAIAALTYNVLLALNQLGIGDALTYLEDRVEEASRTALSMVLAAGLILMGITWAFSPLIAQFFHSPGAVFVLRGFALGLPFDAAAQMPIGRMTRSLSFARRTVTDSLPTLIGSAVTIGVVIGGHPLVGLVAGQVVGAVARLAVAMIVGPWCLPGWNTAMARRLLRYGGYLTAADILNLGLLNVDYITVGHVLGPVALGIYSLAYRICFMPYLSISAVANGALFPYYCRLPSREAKARTAENVFCLINAASIPWFAGLVLFADDIALLGGKWAPAAGAVRFLAVYGFFLSAILSNLQVLKAGGRTDLVSSWAGACTWRFLTAVLIATVHVGITVVALDQAVVAAAIAVTTGLWTIRHASLRSAAVARSVGLPLIAALGMVLVVLVGGRSRAASTPSWTSLLILGRWPWASSGSSSEDHAGAASQGMDGDSRAVRCHNGRRGTASIGGPEGSPSVARGCCCARGCRHDGGRRGRSRRHREVAAAHSGRARRCRCPRFAAIPPQSRGRRARGGLLLQCVSGARGRTRHGRQGHRRPRRDGLGPAVGGQPAAGHLDPPAVAARRVPPVDRGIDRRRGQRDRPRS